ncbi:MAG: site-2 protease family protein [Pseudomonadota bacterium]
MSWSFRIATIGGTALRIHVTFLLLLAWIGWVSWQSGGAEAAIDGLVFVLLVFLCVALHEGGHALAARRYGIRTPDITLLPIGGLARLDRMPERPTHELVVAGAGPLVNLVIAGVLFLLLGARLDAGDLAAIERAEGSLLARLVGVNVMLVLFNLLPAFPLDGGRMLRALLAYRLSRGRATRIAARIGQVFGVAFAVVGVLYSPLLLLIAVFIFFAADAESRLETRRERSAAHTVGNAMIAGAATLRPGDTLRQAGQLVLSTTQQHFPVIDAERRLLGVVTRLALARSLQGAGPDASVTEAMQPLATAGPDEPLLPLMPEMLGGPIGAIAVVDEGGRYIGYLSGAEVAAGLLRTQLSQGETIAG